jgi:hypothetical protein
METKNQPLLDYITEQIKNNVPVLHIKRILLNNDWQESVIDEAFAQLGIATAIPPATSYQEPKPPFHQEGITMDKIIEKFIPLAGALLLIVGFGYLIYANAWVNLTMEIKLTLGFFFSVTIIGASF